MADEKKTVLVADDEVDSIEFVRNVLEDDFDVIAVSDGVKALKAAKEHVPSLVILDIQMPNKDGFATFNDLRQDPVHPRHPAHRGHQADRDRVLRRRRGAVHGRAARGLRREAHRPGNAPRDRPPTHGPVTLGGRPTPAERGALGRGLR